MKREVPHITAELFTIPLDDVFLVYAPLRQAAFIANPRVVNTLADLQEGNLDPLGPDADPLIEFLRRLQIIDGGAEIKPTERYAGDPKPTSLTLFLTTMCNLRCTYRCYASAGDTSAKRMPLEVAHRGIDFVVGNALELRRDTRSVQNMKY